MKLRLEYLPREAAVLRAVAGWIHGEWAHLNPGRTFEKVYARLGQRAGSRKLPLTILARDGRRAIGTASLLLNDMDRRRDLTPWLGAVYVAPEYRGRGVGAALCRRVEAEAARLGLGRLYLFTEDREDFYAKMDWKPEERTEYRGQRVVIMSKLI